MSIKGFTVPSNFTIYMGHYYRDPQYARNLPLVERVHVSDRI